MSDSNIYEHEDRQYFLGCTPMQHEDDLLMYADSGRKIYSEQEILAAINAGRGSLAWAIWCILDQNGYGDCWMYAAVMAMIAKIKLLYGMETLLDTSIGPAITGQPNGGSIDSMLVQVQAKYGNPTAAFMGTDPTIGGKVKRSRSQWPSGWEADAKKRIVPNNEWLRSGSWQEQASGIIDGHPGPIGLNWANKGGHAICCAEITTSAKASAEIDATAATLLAAGQDADPLLRMRDRVAELLHIDWGSASQFLFGGPNSWSKNFTSGWGSYPGRPGWWLIPVDSSSMGRTWGGFGGYVLTGVKDEDAEAAPAAK